MNRLTKKINHYGKEIWVTEHGYDNDIGYSMGEAINKLAAYENLEEQGLLIKLPCKFNENTVYYIDKSKNLHYGYIEEVRINEFNTKYTYINSDNEWDIQFIKGDIGKTIFLTREEAEKALEGIK